MLQIDQPKELKTFRHEAMATDFFAYLGGHSDEYLRQASYEAFLLVDDLENKLSLYQQSSDVSRVNLAKRGEKVTVSSAFIDCLQQAAEASAFTAGKFDPFLGRAALKAKGQILSHVRPQAEDSELNDFRLKVDAQNRIVEKTCDDALLDFGGIGKGYALDCLKEHFEEWDVDQGILSASGSTLLFLKPLTEQQNWTASIGEAAFQIQSDSALSSSGTGFQEEHIIDPRTLESSSKWLRSYSLAPSAALADALSTAALLASETELSQMVEAKSDIALSVEQTGETYLHFGDKRMGAVK